MFMCQRYCDQSAFAGYWRWPILLLLFALPSLAACGREMAVDEDDADFGEPAVFSVLAETQVPEKPGNVAQAHAVDLDRARLILIQRPGRVMNFILMPDGRRLDYEVLEVEGDPPRVWRGRLHDAAQPVASLTLSRSGERLTGRFRLDGDHYSLRADGAGEVMLLKFDDTEPPPHGQPVVPENG